MSKLDDDIPIGKIPLRGRLQLLRDALTYVKPEKEDEFRYRDILYFTSYLLPLRWAIAVSVMLTFLASLLATAMPLSSKWIIDYVFLKESIKPFIDSLSTHHLGFLAPVVEQLSHSLFLVIVVLVLVYVVAYFVSNEISLINYRINTEYGYRVKMDVFSRVMRYPITYFKSTRSGYLLARISSDTGNLNSVSSEFLQNIISSGTVLLVSASVLWSLSVPLTVFVVCTVPVTVLLSYYIVKFSRSYAIRMRDAGLQMSADGQDMISAIDLIKIHAAEDREIAKYEKVYRHNIALGIANMLFGQVTGGVQQAITLGIRLCVMLYGGSLVLTGKMSIGGYTAFLVMYPQLTGSITSFLQMPLSLQYTAISAGRVKELLCRATEFEHEDPSRKLIVPKLRAQGNIRCEHISFSYEEGAPVLTDLTIHIKEGERIGIIGTTGAGKTTFIHLLLKFYKPQSGNIFIDGYDVSDLNPTWIRDQVGLVSQELMLFHDTIFNNILYSKPEAGEDEIYRAARCAGIHDEIMKFPQGYATVVGERGSKLSGGQKQRIAIARAFLKDAPIIILDEPTAHLDLDTEKRLIDEFVKICEGRTTIIITHRDSLLHFADRIYEVRDGYFSEQVKK